LAVKMVIPPESFGAARSGTAGPCG
jgi:hypothetical protein